MLPVSAVGKVFENYYELSMSVYFHQIQNEVGDWVKGTATAFLLFLFKRVLWNFYCIRLIGSPFSFMNILFIGFCWKLELSWKKKWVSQFVPFEVSFQNYKLKFLRIIESSLFYQRENIGAVIWIHLKRKRFRKLL